MILDYIKEALSIKPQLIPISLIIIVTNVLFVALQHVLVSPSRELLYIVQGVSVLVAFEYFLILLLDIEYPLTVWLTALALFVHPLFFGPDVLSLYPHYYFTLLTAIIFTTPFVTLFVRSVRLEYVAIRLSGRFKMYKRRIDRDAVIYAIKAVPTAIVTAVVSLFIGVSTGFTPAYIVSAFSFFVFLDSVFWVARKISAQGEAIKRRSLAIMFAMEYGFMNRLMELIRKRIKPIIPKTGELIYDTEVAAKGALFIVTTLLLTPLVVLVLIIFYGFVGGVLGLVLSAIMIYAAYIAPSLWLQSKISAREKETEAEYPLFLAFVITVVSAGVSLYRAMVMIAEAGKTLFPRFSKEAQYIISLVQKGSTENQAITEYAETHPSEIVRDFFLGMGHQLALGANVISYMIMKLEDALATMRDKLERVGSMLGTMVEFIVIIVVLPVTAILLGVLLAPGIIMPILLVDIAGIIPSVSVLYLLMMPKLYMPNEYRINYVPAVVGGLIGLLVGLLVARNDVLAAVAIVIAGIAGGIYVQYSRIARTYRIQEMYLPQILRDLAILRSTRSLVQAIEELSEMDYPKEVKEPLTKMAVTRKTGTRFGDQPFYSGAWIWRFFQTLLAKIEATGGGTPEMFRLLMRFFTSYNSLVRSFKSKAIYHEIISYVIPVILTMIIATTMSFFQYAPNLSSLQTTSTNIPVSASLPMLSLSVPQIAITMARFSILEIVMAISLVVGKLSSGTVLNTRVLMISSIITAIMFLYGDTIFSTFFGRGLGFAQ